MQRQNDTAELDDLAVRNRRMLLTVFGIVLGMIGLAFASVPLYSLFCRVTGWSGTTQVAEAFPDQDDVLNRQMTVRFDANTASNLPWEFGPERLSVDVKVGDRGFINYIAENTAGKPVAGTALFNVTPLKAGKYFQKVQCFCFDEQILQPGESVNMPVLFYVDPKIQDDPNMDDVKVITLSYSFFKADSEQLDQAYEAFYER